MDKIPLFQRLGEVDAKDLTTKFARIYTDEYCAALERYFGGSGFVANYETQILPAVKYYPDTRLHEALALILERPDDAWAPLLSQILITPFIKCLFPKGGKPHEQL